MKLEARTPHGPGFSFVDRAEVLEPGKRLAAVKRLDPGLLFFSDHFPGNPLMPGVLLIECAAQAAGLLWGTIHRSGSPECYALAQVLQFKLLQPVLPDAVLDIVIELERDFGSLAQFSTTLAVKETMVAAGKIILSRPPPPSA